LLKTMVNPGHPSNGCATCKLRRVKCDQAWPQCRRCTKGKRICTGYREDLGNLSKFKEQTKGRSLPCCHRFASNTTSLLLTSRADTMTDACDNHPKEAIYQSAGGHADVDLDTDRPYVGLSIISIVQTCFEGLTNPALTLETRRLMLQNYQIAIKLLRSALAAHATDRSLAAPIRALALYEVRCEPFCPTYYPK
jgi:hypothetical protein